VRRVCRADNLRVSTTENFIHVFYGSLLLTVMTNVKLIYIFVSYCHAFDVLTISKRILLSLYGKQT
jgi:hypothetical protein